MPVDLELAIGVLVVVCVRAPSHREHVVDEGGHQVEVAVEGKQVVARFSEHVEFVVGPVGPVLVGVEEHEFGFDPDVERVTECVSLLELSLQDGPGTEVERLSLDLNVAGHPGHVVTPRHSCEGTEIRDVRHVRIVRALSHLASRESGKAGAFRGHLIQIADRYNLGLRGSSHFDEGAEE